VLGIAQLLAAALIFFIPLAPWFWLLLAILVCKGFAEGFVNTGQTHCCSGRMAKKLALS